MIKKYSKITRLLFAVFFVIIMFITAACSRFQSTSETEAAAQEDIYLQEGEADSGLAESASAIPIFDSDEYSFNTEEYSSITENTFLSAAAAPLSTFSADVDTASYSNIRRMVLDHETIPPDAVRIEEMINYFHYDYPEPEGSAPFSITTELADCPWNTETKLLLIGLQAKKIDPDKLPNSNIVFLLDVSGSMDEPNKLPLIKKSFSLLSESLKKTDIVSIVTYAGNDSIVLDGAAGNDHFKITNALDGLMAGGGTAGAKGIETAYDLAKKHYIPGGNNRIILATDGDLNIGISSEGDLKRLIEKKRESGIFITVLGFGMGNLKDNKMETLANNGNGNYGYIDSLHEAKKTLVEEFGGTMFTVAKDVKIQLEFNPSEILGYRLIGYENRILRPEDFENDNKDAGEIGSGHRVTALYEISPVGSNQEIPTPPALKYQNNNTHAVSQSNEWLTIHIRYKEPDSNESNLLSKTVDKNDLGELKPNSSFAAGVAQFGMLLRESEFAKESTFSSIAERLSALEAIANDKYKSEFLYILNQMD